MDPNHGHTFLIMPIHFWETYLFNHTMLSTLILHCTHEANQYLAPKSLNQHYLEPTAPSPESWLPASLGVLTDLEDGDIGGGTK